MEAGQNEELKQEIREKIKIFLSEALRGEALEKSLEKACDNIMIEIEKTQKNPSVVSCVHEKDPPGAFRYRGGFRKCRAS